MKLPPLLQTLIEEIIELCELWKKEGKLRKEIRFYQKYKVEEFEYKEGGGIQTSGSFPIIQKEEWNISDIFRLIEYIKFFFFQKLYKTYSRRICVTIS